MYYCLAEVLEDIRDESKEEFERDLEESNTQLQEVAYRIGKSIREGAPTK